MVNLYKISVYLSIFCIVVKFVLSKSIESEDFYDVVEPSSLSYFFDGMILLLSLLFIKKISSKFYSILVFFAFSTVTFTFASYFSNEDFFSAIKTSMKYFVPIMALIHYYGYFKTRESELIKVIHYLSFIVLILLLYGFVFLPMSSNRYFGDNEGLWWPAYFNNLHTTTYVVSALFYMYFCMYLRGRIDQLKLVIIFCVCFYFIAFGWGIRTATLSIVAIVFLMLAENINKYQKYFKITAVITLLSIIPIWYNYFFDFDLYSAYSSGRLSMYVEKYFQLSENNLFQWLFGNGAGSDLIETDFWWDARGAHSDFITVLVEGGIVYFMFFIVLHIKIYSLTVKSRARFILYSIALTGLFSNGFFVRPVAMYLCIFAIILGMIDNDERQNAIK